MFTSRPIVKLGTNDIASGQPIHNIKLVHQTSPAMLRPFFPILCCKRANGWYLFRAFQHICRLQCCVQYSAIYHTCGTLICSAHSIIECYLVWFVYCLSVIDLHTVSWLCARLLYNDGPFIYLTQQAKYSVTLKNVLHCINVSAFSWIYRSNICTNLDMLFQTTLEKYNESSLRIIC